MCIFSITLSSWFIRYFLHCTGSRRKVSSSTKLPSNFPAFLRESKNKEEFFQFLTDVVIAECTLPDGKELQITDGK